MEVVDYQNFLRILKDLKSKNKRIGGFTTTGKIHLGHLEGIKRIRESSDIVTVLFVNYLSYLYKKYLNLTLCSYSNYFLEDLNILRSAGVDYVSARNYEKEIEEDLLKERKVVIDEIPLLSSLGILSDPFKTVDSLGREGRNLRMWSIAFALRINPDEYFYDSLWTGDKSFHFYIAEMIAKKRNIPLKYKYYPVVRDNNGIPFHSDISLTQMDAEKKQLLTDYPKEVINNLLKSGKLEKSEPKGFLFELFEKDTLQKVLTIKEGKEYFLTYGYARELGELPATDCFRILG